MSYEQYHQYRIRYAQTLSSDLQRPDVHSKMTLPYLYLNYPVDAQNTPGARVPWLASQTDILAEDWYEI